jgi:hypothetical protein
MRRRGHRCLERRRTARREQLLDSAAGLELEVLPVGVRDAQHRLVAPQTRDVVGQAPQAGQRHVEDQRVILSLAASLALAEQVGQARAHVLERQRSARAFPQQRVDRDALDPSPAHDVAAIDSLEHRESRHQADDRTGRGSADGVHADVESVLVAEMVEPDEQRGGGPGLVRAERSAPGQRHAEAQVGHG